MISPCNIRDGMDAVAYVEATRFGVWAILTGHKLGKLGHEFLRAWGRVQACLHMALVSTGPADPTVGRMHLLNALPPADLLADEVCLALSEKDADHAARAAKVLKAMKEMCWEATRPPADMPHPSSPPVSNGTHRSTRKPNAR